MNTRVIIAALGAAAAVIVLFGVLRSGGDKPSGPRAQSATVVVSIEPFAYFVEKLAPGMFRSVVMLPASANHDTYEPTIEQLKAVSQAQLFIKVGHPSFVFEKAWLNKIIDENAQARVINASDGIELKSGDPHIWLSPRAALTIARSIAEGLSAARPDARDAITANLRLLEAEIERVDEEVRRILAQKRGAAFLVNHSAWHYFADNYGLRELAIEKEGKEPDAAEVSALLTSARAAGIKTLLVEPQFSRASAETIAGELDAEVKIIDHMRRDWSTNIVEAARIINEAAK